MSGKRAQKNISFFVRAGIFALVLLLVFLPQFVPASSNTIYVLQLDDATINPVTAEYITGAIDDAVQENARCVIIKLDTPGGLLTSTRSIVKKILSSKVPIVVYVYPRGSRAGSAGVFITYASHIAAMAPSTNIGAAHPVELAGTRQSEKRTIWDALRDTIDFERERKKSKAMDTQTQEKEKITAKNEIKTKTTQEIQEEHGKPPDEDPMSSKILNDTVAFIKSIAKERNRNLEWAELSVTRSYSITEKEALEKGVVEIIAADENDLIAKLDGRVVTIDGQKIILKTNDATVQRVDMDFRQRFLNILANPNIAYIFFILGFYGLLYEVTHPGAALPGVLGTIFLILAFFSMQMLPTNYAGLALIILAIILFIAEAKAAGFGLFTLGGLVCMILGSLMLFDSATPLMRVSIGVILAFSLTTAAITIFLVRLVIISHRRKVVSGNEGLVGERGSAYTPLLPNTEGKVFVHGEIWNAVSQDEIQKDAAIVVVAVEGMTLKVKRT